MELTSTAAALSTYGLYAIVAVLMLAVMHLYKEHNRLVDEIRKNMRDDNKEISKLLAESNEVIKRNTQAMESFETASRQMSDTTRQLSEMVTQVRAIAGHHQCAMADIKLQKGDAGASLTLSKKAPERSAKDE